MLNKQGPGKIDWTDWTWNPISGCLHGCGYCYMLRMEKRFPEMMKPAFHPDRLAKIRNTKKVKPGDKIFVGSSGDMWGNWVHAAWISHVLVEIYELQQCVFQFLTKNPIGYRDWHFDGYDHCWFGTTVDGTGRTKSNIMDMICSLPKQSTKFVSFEPLLSPVHVTKSEWKELDWIIIGANSNRGAAKPPNEWARTLIVDARFYGVPVWVKDNYGYPEQIKEWPGKNPIGRCCHDRSL